MVDFRYRALQVLKVISYSKCNLMVLTTKSACVPLVFSSVDTYVHMLEFHVLVNHSLAYVQEAFSGVFCSVAAHHPGSYPRKINITGSLCVCIASLACFSSCLNESAFGVVN